MNIQDAPAYLSNVSHPENFLFAQFSISIIITNYKYVANSLCSATAKHVIRTEIKKNV